MSLITWHTVIRPWSERWIPQLTTHLSEEPWVRAQLDYGLGRLNWQPVKVATSALGGSIQGCILKIVSILRLYLVQHVLITLEKFWEAHSLGSWSHFWQKLTYQIGENSYFRQNSGFLHLLFLLFKLINEYCLTCLCISSVLTCLNSIYINIIWLFAIAECQ